jgi:phosphonate transport system substrate-binding protein
MAPPIFRRTRAAAIAAIALIGGATLAACGSSVNSTATANTSHPGWPSTITIGSIPTENAAQLEASLAPIQKMITKKLGVQVKVFSGTSYAALIEAQKAHKVDLVVYGPLSYYIAENQHIGVENVGIEVQSATDNGNYNSIGWANASQTSVHSLKDFAGKKTCFVDPASTSGYLFPSYGLEQAGVNPTSGVKPVFAGAHDASFEAIAKGTCQVGFTESVPVPQELEASGKVKASQIREVWKSPTIPGSPIAVSTDLPASFRAALEKVLDTDANVPQLVKAGLCSSDASCQSTLGMWGFKPPSVANFSVITQVCNETKSVSCTKP